MGILDNLRRKSHKEESGANHKKPLRDAKLLLESGIKAYFEGWTEDAVRDLEAAIKIDPKSYAALGTLGNAYARMGAHEKAIKAFQQCILLADRSESHANMGNSYMALGDFASAVSEFEKAMKLNPNDNVAQNNLPIVRKLMKGNAALINLNKYALPDVQDTGYYTFPQTADKEVLKLLKYVWPDMEFEFAHGIMSNDPTGTNIKRFISGERIVTVKTRPEGQILHVEIIFTEGNVFAFDMPRYGGTFKLNMVKIEKSQL